MSVKMYMEGKINYNYHYNYNYTLWNWYINFIFIT